MNNKTTIFTLMVLALAIPGIARGYAGSTELRPFDAAASRGGYENENVVRYQKNQQIQLAQLSVEEIALEAEVVDQRANPTINNTAQTDPKQAYDLADGKQNVDENKAAKVCCDFEEKVSNQEEDLTASAPVSEEDNTGNVTSRRSEEAINQAPDNEGVANEKQNAGDTKPCCDSNSKDNTADLPSRQSEEAPVQGLVNEGVTDGRQNDNKKEVKPCCDSWVKVFDQEEQRDIITTTPGFEQANAGNQIALQSEEALHQEFDIEDVAAGPRNAKDDNLGKLGSRRSQGVSIEDTDQNGVVAGTGNADEDKIANPQFVSFRESGQPVYESWYAFNVTHKDQVDEERIG